MPHYADGTEAKVGDVVSGKDYKARVVGVVLDITPGSATCNMTILQCVRVYGDGDSKIATPSTQCQTATCSEFNKVF